jgi:hypothetical protein
MSANDNAPPVNARRTIAELEAELEKCTAERDEALARENAVAQSCRSSIRRRAISRRYSTRCSKKRRGYARPRPVSYERRSESVVGRLPSIVTPHLVRWAPSHACC